MKKILIIATLMVMLYLSFDYLYYYEGSVYLPRRESVESFTLADKEKLWVDKGEGFEVFNIKGVNLGTGKPGHFAPDHTITKEEYLRWFKDIKALGANLIRIYTLRNEAFYEAFYQHNIENPSPLYLIHGVQADEYMINSRQSALDNEFYADFLKKCKDVVDTIHGRNKIARLENAGAQTYKRDISPWVYGYLIGTDWRGEFIAYTNESKPRLRDFEGEYLYTYGAENFEVFLARVGDEMIAYETSKYGAQRTLAFSNSALTDPFEYDEKVALQYEKFYGLNVEHIKSTEAFKSGMYAAYHVYPYTPEFMNLIDENIENTYLHYLERLNDHHQMPVVISEFGVPSSRGISSYEQNRNLGRDQGNLDETEQGHALVSLYEDIMQSGSAGAIVFMWQDEWFKSTWNTIPFVGVNRSVYWNDYQTNTQSFGLLAFDPGTEKSVVYVDGDKSDWTDVENAGQSGDYRISLKYDEKFLYFLVEKEGFSPDTDTLYIPLDLTPESGSRSVEDKKITMTHHTDFLIEIRGKEDSRVLVQERYDAVMAVYGRLTTRGYREYEDPPDKDSPVFAPVLMVLHEQNYYNLGIQVPFKEFDMTRDGEYYKLSQTFETGKLLHGNASPDAPGFSSLADYSFGKGFVEIRLPWQLLNFSDPSRMKIHKDYYANFGVEEMEIDHLFIGAGDEKEMIEMKKFALKPFDDDPRYHERLKKSYRILQDHWSAKK